MFFSSFEEFVGELPSVWYYLPKTISVKLADEAGKVVVLKVLRKEVTSEFRWTPDDESGVIFTPRDDVIGRRVIY